MMRSLTLVAGALAGLVLAHGSLAADITKRAPGKQGAEAVVDATGLYWYEDGRKQALRIDAAWVADFSAPVKGPGRASTPLKRFVGGEKALETLPEGSSPVFRDDNGATRALAGGVVVRLREADVPEARARLVDAGLLPVRPLDPEGRTWLVASPTGMPSLQLANQLHERGGFESASPNWWRPRSLK